MRTTTRERLCPRDGDRQAGNVIILGLGIWMMVCILLAGSVALAIVALERSDLMAQAEAIALAAADDLDSESYYAGESVVVPQSAAVAATAHELAPPGTLVGEPTGVSGSSVEVTLTRKIPLAFVPQGMPLSAIDVSVTSRARLRDL